MAGKRGKHVNALYFSYFEQILFRMSNSHFSWCKLPSNNVDFDYSKVSTIQIGFCLSKLCYCLLVWTQIECINKQLFIRASWLNKSIWKSGFRKAIKDGFMDRCTNQSITFTLFLILFLLFEIFTIRKCSMGKCLFLKKFWNLKILKNFDFFFFWKVKICIIKMLKFVFEEFFVLFYKGLAKLRH